MGVAQRKQDRRLEVFEDTYAMWTERRLTQAQAAEVRWKRRTDICAKATCRPSTPSSPVRRRRIARRLCRWDRALLFVYNSRPAKGRNKSYTPALRGRLAPAGGKRMRFEGIYTPVITPFRDDLSIDFDAYGKILDWQADNGVHGIIIGGSTGEFFSLTQEERIEQFNFAADRIAGRLPMIAGVNDLLVERCYELTAAAREAGAGALLVAAPPYGLPSQDELAAHCLEIDRIANLPIILYNYPDRTGVSMEKAFLDRIVQNDNFLAIKESSGEIGRMQMLAREYPQLQLSAGSEDLVLEFFAWGARSWVSVVANFFPCEAVRFYQICVLEGDFVTGRKIMAALLPLMVCLEQGGKFLQSVKYACELLDRPGGPVRPPFQPMAKEHRGQLQQIVETARTRLRAILGEANPE